MRTASLGMYDHPALQAANDALWGALAERLIAAGVAGVPSLLDRGRALDAIWSDVGLLLAQTCGYPLVTTFAGKLRYVATPCYRAAGCAGPLYRSRIVVRMDDPAESLSDLRGARAALNDASSNSGMNLLRAALAPLAVEGRFLSTVIETGSHLASLRAVADGLADLAAIDVVTFAHLQRHEPTLTGAVRTIAWTAETPGLPLVTSVDTSDADLAKLRAALSDCVRDPVLASVREVLLLEEIERLPELRYHQIMRLERSAQRAGYPELEVPKIQADL